MSSPETLSTLEKLRKDAVNDRKYIDTQRTGIDALKVLLKDASGVCQQDFLDTSLKELESQEIYLMSREKQLASTLAFIASLEHSIDIIDRLNLLKSTDLIKAVY